MLASLEEPRRLVLAVLDNYEASGIHLERPGVTMFAEWVALAATVRLVHIEPRLKRDDIEAFLPAAVEMLNTLFCGPPKYAQPEEGGFSPSGKPERKTAIMPELDTPAQQEHETGNA
jgi:hypothetical protein